MTRTKSALKNFSYALIGQVGGLLVSFIARNIFVQILTKEYLGVNGLFTNILTVLSFAELGFGTAITYSLYKPLSTHDTEKIKSLMALFKKIYLCVGGIVLIAGFSLTPFLSFFIKDIPDIPNLQLIYVLFVLNSAISYFFSYKRTLIIADQNRYVATYYRYLFYISLNIAQMISLIVFKNYIIFLVLQILFTLIENISVSIKADKMYPYLKERNIQKLTEEDNKEIFKNTKAMMMHKVGGIVVNSTDNIIISKYVGLAAVGLYSNYLLIKSALETVIGQFFSSLSASVGNLCVTETEEKQYSIFKVIDFIGFWIFSFTSISFLVLSKSFITLWLGKDFIFPFYTTLLIIIIYYITGLRKAIITYREALGLFYKDRYKPLLEALVNIVVSVLLAKKYGINGVLIGTIASSIFVAIEWEVYILFHYGFKRSIFDYYKKYFVYLVITILAGGLTYFLSTLSTSFSMLTQLIISGILCMIIPNLIITLIFCKTKEFAYLKELVLGIIKKRKVVFR